MRLIHELFGGVVAAKFNDVRDQWRQHLVVAGVVAFCALAALGGLGFIAAGSYFSLRQGMAAWQAGLIVGGGVLVLSLIGALSARFFVHRRAATQQSSTNQPAPETVRIDSIAHLGETLGASVSKHGIRMADVMIGAMIAGTLLGASRALRERLLGPRRCRSRGSVSNPDHRHRVSR